MRHYYLMQTKQAWIRDASGQAGMRHHPTQKAYYYNSFTEKETEAQHRGHRSKWQNKDLNLDSLGLELTLLMPT